MPKTKTTASSKKTQDNSELKELIAATVKLWRKHHLTYDQAGYVGKEVRCELKIKRAAVRKTVLHRLSRDEEQKLIAQAYRDKGGNGLLLKTLFLTGARLRVRVRIGTLLRFERNFALRRIQSAHSLAIAR